MNSIFISAIHKSSGKTTVTLGLSAVLTRRGAHIQTFKKGPDYIDPIWLSRASGRPCRNLDYHFMTDAEIANEFVAHGKDADLSIIEGNKGLFDGVDVEGSDSNAALAEALGSPIILVVDTRGMTRGIAPLIKGYTDFAEDIKIAGIILNQVGGPRHESKLRNALERYTDVPVIGSIGRRAEMAIAERHLGLIPANEQSEAAEKIDTIATIVEENIDLGIFGALACTTKAPPTTVVPHVVTPSQEKPVRIAIARDAAFGFYYPRDLEALERAGAELVAFDTLTDARLPDADGLFIGGGFPETQVEAIAANTALQEDIYNALNGGMPAYAECAGLMYLSESLSWQGRTHKMVGVIPGRSVMNQKPVGRGYVNLVETGLLPWPGEVTGGDVVRAHEFHYAALEGLPSDTKFAYQVTRGVGVDGANDGIIIGNLVAGFAHHFHTNADQWAERFVGFVRQCAANSVAKPHRARQAG